MKIGKKDERVLSLINDAVVLLASDFVDRHLLSDFAFVFHWDVVPYIDFCRGMEKRLGVSDGAIKLIGSAKLGFSLNTDHLLRSYRSDSDLDLVVVSSEVFDEAALDLRQHSKKLALASSDERRHLKRSRDNIFSGFLRPDQLPISSRLSSDWFPRLAGPYTSEPARSHEVKAWLFKSWDHVRIYYTEYHEKLQPSLVKLTAKSEV